MYFKFKLNLLVSKEIYFWYKLMIVMILSYLCKLDSVTYPWDMCGIWILWCQRWDCTWGHYSRLSLAWYQPETTWPYHTYRHDITLWKHDHWFYCLRIKTVFNLSKLWFYYMKDTHQECCWYSCLLVLLYFLLSLVFLEKGTVQKIFKKVLSIVTEVDFYILNMAKKLCMFSIKWQ